MINEAAKSHWTMLEGVELNVGIFDERTLKIIDRDAGGTALVLACFTILT
jgi:hypothetical protein